MKSRGGKPIIANYNLAPGCWEIRWSGSFTVNGNNRNVATNSQLLTGWPEAVMILPTVGDEIRTEIPLEQMTSPKRALLRIAFGKDIHPGEFTQLTKLQRRGAVKQAEDRLNDRLAQFLPETLHYRFVLEPPSEPRPMVEIGLLDAHGGYSALGQRGAGLRKMINLLGRLAVENIGSGSTLLLLDEPENSLHADAQHALRYALEQLGELESVQIIYATHSSAMINPMRPENVRLLRRVQRNQQAWTVFDNKPVTDNFAVVRTSLGISPADSLLYCPVTILVEGATEARCIPKLLRRLCEAKISGFEDVLELLGNCLVVSVRGDSFASQCTLAKGFNVIPVVYADGDKAKQAQQQLRANHSGVEIITPADPTHEAEHLVSTAAYFRALTKFLDKPEEEVNETKFNEWDAAAQLNPKMMFSKRIRRWVEDNFDPNFSGKPEILFDACREVRIEEVQTESLLRLVDAIRRAVAKSVQPFTPVEEI
jgi:hypothetical protein